eukprot:gb/GECG01004653.1/.p1 GENE.gb/GECG01004653.1/~~gb/GECG01004653.1/.p1  ORF type:complete len:100 (+),score=4.43 gb/GECG01004653.1/:1-300(+)
MRSSSMFHVLLNYTLDNEVLVTALSFHQGGQRFYTDLTDFLNKLHGYKSHFNCVPFTSDFVRVKSYQGAASTGNGGCSHLLAIWCISCHTIVSFWLCIQ